MVLRTAVSKTMRFKACGPPPFPFLSHYPEETMNKKTILALAGFVGFALSGMASAVDMHTKTIASTCMSCHGPGGRARAPFEPRPGWTKDYFVKSMKDFRRHPHRNHHEAPRQRLHRRRIRSHGAYFCQPEVIIEGSNDSESSRFPESFRRRRALRSTG
jgi:cytochrome c553